MGPILFLDFDGVLHPTGGRATGVPFSQVPLLEALLREPRFAAVKIVVSSTWRETYSLGRLRQVFAPDMQDRVIDVTPALDDYDGPHQRHAEICAWLKAHPEVTRWTVLDDHVHGFPRHWHGHVVFTDSHLGLVASDIAALRARLVAHGA